MKREPKRLLEPESSADSTLRDVLRMTSASTPGEARIEALALKVAAATGTRVGPNAASEVSSHWTATTIATASVAALIAGAAIGLNWDSKPSRPLEHQHKPPPSASKPPEQPTVVPIAPEPSPRPSPPTPLTLFTPPAPRARAQRALQPRPKAASPVASAELGDPPEPPPVSAPNPPTPPVAHTVEVSSRPIEARADPAVEPVPAAREANAAPLPPELKLLSRAQELLIRDPRAALDRIEQHANTYPRGKFAEEREALAIDALHRLGDEAALRLRARDFLNRYPRSPHRARIAALLR